MQRKVLYVFLSLFFLVTLLLAVRFLVLGARKKTGVLKISTNISARVLLDDKEWGKTPFEDKVPAQEYTLKLVPDQSGVPFASWQGRITVGSNLLTYVNRDLSESELTSAGEILSLEPITSNKAELTVLTVPDGAHVVLDDVPKGVAPISLTDLSAGDHVLVVTSAGFESRTTRIKLTAGYKLTTSISLALSPTAIMNTLKIEEEATASSQITTPSLSPTVGPTKISPTATPTPTKGQEAVKRVKITQTPTGFLRVRQTASTSSTELAQVKPGDEFDVVSQSTGWYKIEYEEGKQGWVSARYTEVVE